MKSTVTLNTIQQLAIDDRALDLRIAKKNCCKYTYPVPDVAGAIWIYRYEPMYMYGRGYGPIIHNVEVRGRMLSIQWNCIHPGKKMSEYKKRDRVLRLDEIGWR